LDVSRGLVSGARGVVAKFNEAHEGRPVVAFANGILETIESFSWTTQLNGKQVAVRTH